MPSTKHLKSSSVLSSSWPLPVEGVTPFAVQIEGEARAGTREGYLWLHEQGLGKTFTGWANYIRCRAAGLVDTMVVICPNSLKGNWVREAKQWGIDITVNMWPDVTGIAECYIINYEAMIGSGGDWIEKLVKVRNVFLMMDEVHRMKNPTSRVTRQILGNICKDAIIKRGLTGTPMTQSVEDLWPQLRLAGAISGMKAVAFRSRYGTRGGFMGKKTVGINEDRIDELWKLVDTVAHRALKADWLDLPPKLYREQRCELPIALRPHYLTMVEEFIVELENHTISAKMIVSQMIKLQQISSGFVYDAEKRPVRLCATSKLPKFKALMDVIEANGTTSKTIVFCHFRHTAEELIRYIGEELSEIPAFLIGGMKPDEVEHEKASFNGEIAGRSPLVMVAQISAGKEGHTLLGDRAACPCHTVVFYEHNFNLGDRLQSEDRPHRIGQRNPVLYVDLISSPIEAYVRASIIAKQEIVDFVVDHVKDLTKLSEV